jgi:nucleoside 2-deoxyribosyltransferase
MRLYIAAPLFTEAERAFNLVLAAALEAAGHDVYLPQRDTPAVEGAERTSDLLPDWLDRWGCEF